MRLGKCYSLAGTSITSYPRHDSAGNPRTSCSDSSNKNVLSPAGWFIDIAASEAQRTLAPALKIISASWENFCSPRLLAPTGACTDLAPRYPISISTPFYSRPRDRARPCHFLRRSSQPWCLRFRVNRANNNTRRSLRRSFRRARKWSRQLRTDFC